MATKIWMGFGTAISCNALLKRLFQKCVANLKFYRRKKAETQEDYGLQFVVQKGKITEDISLQMLERHEE